MALRATLLHVRWDAVAGATGYEITVDGTRVATAGPRARTTRLSVKDGNHTIAIIDLPNRTLTQEIDLEYADGID